MSKRSKDGWDWNAGIKRLRAGAQNVAEMMRLGRLTAPYRTPFDVVLEGRAFSLRRYHGIERAETERAIKAPVLFIPPLMVTSEIYDMAPDLSAISYLLGHGVDVWLVNFGAPEQSEGGMTRSLDDHVLAVSRAIDYIRKETEQDVHLLGYSQGGMFCYQAAAYRRSEGIASLVTFGSPVDIHKNVPVPMSEQLADKVIGGLRMALERPLQELEGLPGMFTSFGFKMVSPRKEVEQLVDFVRNLHDRQALEKRESRRRFLGGEGFVSWPGPALRTFVDEFIVANRLSSGGFVIDGRTVSLAADLTCPILYFYGFTDDIAQPASVRAIRMAAMNADVHEVGMPAGHLGLVVGSRALSITWPTVVSWLRWIAEEGPMPERLVQEDAPTKRDPGDYDEFDIDMEDFYAFATDRIEGVVKRIGRLGEDMTEAVDSLRWQLPRLNRLGKIQDETRISLGAELAKQAQEIPEQTFFIWRGRAFSYADADRRVSNVVRGLLHCGVRARDRVGVLMKARPSYLSIVTALNRLGAVAVLLRPEDDEATRREALSLGGVSYLVTDTDYVEEAKAVFDGQVMVLGGPYDETRSIPDGAIDMEAIELEQVVVPSDYEPNSGRARDLAFILFTEGRNHSLRAAKITNRRWAFSALGAAAGCTLHPSDTVYCVLPLHHAAGLLVSVGGALVGGARLALASKLSEAHFWNEVRRYGATVVFYAGDMCRTLVDAPPDRFDAQNPVRLFAGSGMRNDVWEKLRNRFKVGILEFYATTEGNAVLANASGKKTGALGRPLPGATDMSLVCWDFKKQDFVYDEQGFVQRAGLNVPGMLIARIEASHPMAGFDGYVNEASTASRVRSNVFEPGDTWFITGDLMRLDTDGDFHYIDRLRDVIHTSGGPVYSRFVEDTIYRLPDVQTVMAYAVGADEEGPSQLVVAIKPREDAFDLARFGGWVMEKFDTHERPQFLRMLDAVPLSYGYRPQKRTLRDEGLSGVAKGMLFERTSDGAYVSVKE